MYSINNTSRTSTPTDGRRVNQNLAVIIGTGDSPAAADQNLIDSANAREDLLSGNYVISLSEDDFNGTWQAIGIACVVS